MSIKVETPGLRALPLVPEIAWRTICYFSNGQNDDAAKYLEASLNEQEKNTQAWLVGFDFCRLTAKQSTLSKLTERYAAVFSRPPPDWISQPVAQPELNQSKGSSLSILSVSNPESDQYLTVFNTVAEKKTAVLLKFTPGRMLSWQDTAVSRLAKGIESLRKANLPIYIEAPEIVLGHIKKIPLDRRSDADWSVLFYFLLYTNQEAVFEEEALQFTLVKGISPPSFEALKHPPIKTWFDVAVGTTEDSGNTIALAGPLSNHIGTLSNRIAQRLQSQESVTLDLRGVSQADWTSIFDIALLHNKIWASGSRKLFIVRPSALVLKMFECAGLPDKTFTTAK